MNPGVDGAEAADPREDAQSIASAETVCALVRDEAGVRSLEGQTRPLDDVVVHDGPVADRLRAGLDRDATWFWLLEDGVVPDAAALAELLEPVRLEPALPVPLLVASKVLGPDGRLDPRSAPWPRSRGALVVEACRHRLVVLRLVGWGSLLVHRDAVTQHGLPRGNAAGGADALGWTACVLAGGHGYLAPRSVARRSDAWTGRSPEGIRELLRLISSDCWAGQERLWFAFRVVDEVTREPRSGTRVRTLAALTRGSVAAIADRRYVRGTGTGFTPSRSPRRTMNTLSRR